MNRTGINKGPQLAKICERCKKPYSVSPSRSASRYCCRECFDAEQAGRRKLVTCAKCNAVFSSRKDHGVWQKFCGRACFEADAKKPEMRPCGNCGGLFLAQASSHGGLRIYCSRKCKFQAQFQGVERSCVNCGAVFRLSPSSVEKRRDESCCSPECRNAYYVGELSPAFKVGAITDCDTGETLFLVGEREGYVGKYMAGRRVAVSRLIGRPVKRGEVVIIINRDPNDWRPENLYLCESNSEFSKRRNGSLPWPTESNLKDFREPT